MWKATIQIERPNKDCKRHQIKSKLRWMWFTFIRIHCPMHVLSSSKRSPKLRVQHKHIFHCRHPKQKRDAGPATCSCCHQSHYKNTNAKWKDKSNSTAEQIFFLDLILSLPEPNLIGASSDFLFPNRTTELQGKQQLQLKNRNQMLNVWSLTFRSLGLRWNIWRKNWNIFHAMNNVMVKA